MIFHCLVRVKTEWKESGVDGTFHPVHHFFSLHIGALALKEERNW